MVDPCDHGDESSGYDVVRIWLAERLLATQEAPVPGVNLMLTSHLYLSLRSSLFPSDFLTKMLQTSSKVKDRTIC
jgi:hypothetical protein